MPTKSITIRMDDYLLKYLTERAEQEHRTLSNTIISMLLTEKENDTNRIRDAIAELYRHSADVLSNANDEEKAIEYSKGIESAIRIIKQHF